MDNEEQKIEVPNYEFQVLTLQARIYQLYCAKSAAEREIVQMEAELKELIENKEQ